MMSLHRLGRLLGGVLILILVGLLVGGALADDKDKGKGKGKGKSQVVTLDLSKLPPGLVKQIEKHLQESKDKKKDDKKKDDKKKDDKKKDTKKKDDDDKKSSKELEARLERLIRELEELRSQIRKK